MQKILVVIDMQNDFITGALGTKEAEAILPRVVEIVKNFDGKIYFTRDTHKEDYMQTQEGKNLPIEHCIENTNGWQIASELAPYAKIIIDKPTFGSQYLANELVKEDSLEKIESVTLVGICTDICVISNAMLIKANLLDAQIIVDASGCAGVTPQTHKNALEAMKMCQITIEND